MAELVDAAEVVEEVVEVSYRHLPLTFAGLGLGLAIGGVAGYFIAEKRLRLRYEEIAQDEITAMREHFHAKALAMENKPALDGLVKDLGYVPAPIPQPDKPVSETLAERVAAHEAQSPEEQAEHDAAVQRNVFEDVAVPHIEEEWDYETEVAQRSPERPYIIHVDEQGEVPELDVMTWTYYEGDEILVNASDEVVTDVDRCIGLSNLDRFGHGSNDPNVVYIRNVVLGIEVEVIRSEGKYEEEVLGLKHADEHFPRRRHFDDD